jgi:hypothetical protein
VIAPVIVVLDEVGNRAFEIAGQVVVFEYDPIFQRQMPTLDFTLCHWMIRRTTRVRHALLIKPFRQILCDIGRAVVVVSCPRKTVPLIFALRRASDDPEASL